MKTIIDFTNKVKSLVDGRMSNIANVEESPSTHAYAVGKQLIFNGLLCKATSAIAVGDTLAVGTNLALSDNVVEQIYSLNQGLTNSLADMNNVLGAKNLLLNTLSSATYNNITFTHNSDDSITITGTSTVWTQTNINDNFKLPSGTYVMSTDTALTSDMYLTLRDIDSSTTVRNLNNDKESTPFTVTDSQNLLLYVGLNAGTYNITIKPMLRPASIEDDTYVPYSMTNRELTDNISNVYTKTESNNRYIPKNSGIMMKTVEGVLTYQADTTKTIGQYIDTLRDNILNDIKSLLVGDEFASINKIYYNFSDYVMENTPLISRSSTTFDIRMSSINLVGTSEQYISSIYKFGTDNAQFGETEIRMSDSRVLSSIKTTNPSSNQSCIVFYTIYKNV